MRVTLLSCCFSLLALAGCTRPAVPAASGPAGAKSVTGWEIRDQAVLALVRRGSPHVKDPDIWDTLTDMLDEDQQLRNFRTRLSDGREVPDETAARMTVISALRAVQELHRKQPTMDLSGLKEPITKLIHSPSIPVSTEAKQAELALFPKT
jgi:hypothetical protein